MQKSVITIIENVAFSIFEDLIPDIQTVRINQLLHFSYLIFCLFSSNSVRGGVVENLKMA